MFFCFASPAPGIMNLCCKIIRSNEQKAEKDKGERGTMPVIVDYKIVSGEEEEWIPTRVFMIACDHRSQDYLTRKQIESRRMRYQEGPCRA